MQVAHRFWEQLKKKHFLPNLIGTNHAYKITYVDIFKIINSEFLPPRPVYTYMVRNLNSETASNKISLEGQDRLAEQAKSMYRDSLSLHCISIHDSGRNDFHFFLSSLPLSLLPYFTL